MACRRDINLTYPHISSSVWEALNPNPDCGTPKLGKPGIHNVTRNSRAPQK